MNAQESVTDQDLHAYVDGELDAPARAAVEKWLGDHPEDAAEVQAIRDQTGLLHEAFGRVADEPLPAAMIKAAEKPERRFTLYRPALVAASILLLAVGGISGWQLRGFLAGGDGGVNQFLRQAVGAHVVYTVEVRHPVEVASDQEAHLVKWLSKRLGNQLKLPRFGDLGYNLVGGRLLPDGANPAAQFMYENDAGKRLTVYVRAEKSARNTSFRFTTDNGVSAFYWIDRPFAYALMGNMTREKLLRLARVFHRDLSGN